MTDIQQEQLKEFWEWCGFWEMSWPSHPRPTGAWFYGSNECELPELTLDSLFKYAVPKLTKDGGYFIGLTYDAAGGYWVGFIACYENHKEYEVHNTDPIQALYQAILQVITEEK